MTRRHELSFDVSAEAGLGEPARVAVSVDLPEEIPERPIVCFAKPGGGYSKGYFTEDLPGPASGSQSAWHASRGWIFVAVDHLGVGASTVHAERTMELDYTTVAAANQAAEQKLLSRLAEGTLVDGVAPVTDYVTIGIGQSMGGCLTVIQQGRYHCYDGIGVLGYGAVVTHPPVRPGEPPIVVPWIPRDTNPAAGVFTNTPSLVAAPQTPRDPEHEPPMAWGFFYDDVDPQIVRLDLVDFPTRNGQVPPWASASLPGTVAAWCLTPGAVAPEAAAVTVPVLVAMGERDVIADPKGEPRAYLSAQSVDLFICPQMGHMHNFAGTRALLWRRLESWTEWVRAVKDTRVQ